MERPAGQGVYERQASNRNVRFNTQSTASQDDFDDEPSPAPHANFDDEPAAAPARKKPQPGGFLQRLLFRSTGAQDEEQGLPLVKSPQSPPDIAHGPDSVQEYGLAADVAGADSHAEEGTESLLQGTQPSDGAQNPSKKRQRGSPLSSPNRNQRSPRSPQLSPRDDPEDDDDEESIVTQSRATSTFFATTMPDGSGLTTRVYPCEEAPWVSANEQALFLQFTRTALGQAVALPARAEVESSGRYAQEKYGLYADKHPRGYATSVRKMEQRLAAEAVAGDGGRADREKAQQGLEKGILATVVEEGTEKHVPAATGDHNPWFDKDGIMISLPNPVKAYPERPLRKFDKHNKPFYVKRRFVKPSVRNTSVQGQRAFRLDIELGRLELAAHPLMPREHWLACRLFTAFREFKRRQAVGLTTLYANRLAALEDALLSAREVMFDLDPAASQQQVAAALERCGVLEMEVAETRQLKEEEELAALQAITDMDNIFRELEEQRAAQGFRLTTVMLALQQLPPDDDALPGGMSREDLDLSLLVAEADQIAGLAGPPHPFDGFEMTPAGFKLRRVERTCAAHAALRAELTHSLTTLKQRISADPQDEEILSLEAQLAELGPHPQRLPRSRQAELACRQRAEEQLQDGQVGVVRLPKIEPILTAEQTAEVFLENLPPTELALQQRVQRLRFYVKLVINGHEVGTSHVRPLRDDFTLDLHDIFSVALVRWPEAAQVKVYEKGTLLDTLVAEFFLTVPGAHGTPPADPAPQPYHWASQTPFVPVWCTPEGSPPPSLSRQGNSPTKAPGSPTKGGLIVSSLYPSGTLFVQCSWLGYDGHREPNSALLGEAARNQAPMRLPAGIEIIPARITGTLEADDLESGQQLMPVAPKKSQTHLLAKRNMVEGHVGKVSKMKLREWLKSAAVDPNDPRNALVLELLKAQAAQDGRPGIFGELGGSGFRLDLVDELALGSDRLALKRADFLKKRWESGPMRHGQPATGGRPPLVTPLSWRDIVERSLLNTDTLSDEDITSRKLGTGWIERQERAMRWQQGAMARAIEKREQRIKEFALRVRALVSRKLASSMLDRRIRTEDVVKDSPLPEFRLNLQFLMELIRPQRKLRPRRKPVKALPTYTASKECRLLITVQKASNLPLRLQHDGRQSPERYQRPSRDPPERAMRKSLDEFNDRDYEDEEEEIRAGPSPTDRPGGDLQPFVEVCFQGVARRTHTSEGDSPLWNEHIALPYIPPDDDMSAAALAEAPDVVTLNVFDEMAEDPEEPSIARSVYTRTRSMLPPSIKRMECGKPDGPPGAAAADDEDCDCVQRERRFLGSVQLPVSAIYQLGTLEGALQLEVPPVVLGYRSSDQGVVPAISVYVTMQPPLQVSNRPADDAAMGEHEDLTRHANRWAEQIALLPQCAKRAIRSVAMDAEGTAALLTRYITPTQPPPGYSGGDPVALARLARFVALIPFLDDSIFRKKRNDIWTTSAELLDMSAGDHEEHANLLAGYFLYAKHQAFVVTGTALSGANACFVLTNGHLVGEDLEKPDSADAPASPDPAKKAEISPTGQASPQRNSDDVDERDEHGRLRGRRRSGETGPTSRSVSPNRRRGRRQSAEPPVAAPVQALGCMLLWNPLTGHCFDVRDMAADLREVHMVFDGSNMWANIQMHAEPWQISWDLEDRNAWRPFFSPAFPPRELGTLQTLIKYEELDDQFYEDLEAKVEDTVREAISKARRTVLTNTNKRVSRVLKKLLQSVADDVTELGALACGGGPLMANQAASNKLRAMRRMESKHEQVVSKEARSSLVTGHVIGLPLSDGYGDAIRDAVLNTGIHMITDEHVKFAMASHVERTGVKFVCCIWIYVAAIRDPRH
ncbi:hypothetical protein WJX72_000007 [[Myrmecia] bisecta]|uniref:C2 domain-containing protein n=1 Tax=[Myrmecia] bisecta TaxID=41462 RepID=A0AAW1PF69_9CHLO